MTQATPGEGDDRADAGIEARADERTGAYIVLLDPTDLRAGMSALQNAAGVSAAEWVDAAGAGTVDEILAGGGAAVLPEIGVAVVTVEPDQRQPLLRTATEVSQVLVVEPERVVYALADGLPLEYLRGFRDAVDTLIDTASRAGDGHEPSVAQARVWDESRATWGLQAVRATESCASGRGVRVAVLDTGVDADHRDLAGRAIKAMSFIPGQSADDGHGHGTHCIGTACGPRDPRTLPRYGLAGDSEIYAGKVLSDQGSGSDRSILAGINWAVAEGCQVISMSLGAPTAVGDTYSQVYEVVAQRALAKGAVIVAAAGNESGRPGVIKPVGHPANCPSILAVAALTSDLTAARFSCAGLNPDGGQIDIAGPGVNVSSAWPEPTGYRSISGTSMATPHVAGVLALLAETNPGAGPSDLKALLAAKALRLPLPSTDVGAGLVQAP